MGIPGKGGLNMPRCAAKTKRGTQCKNSAPPDSRFCQVHQGYSSQSILPSVIGGAAIGHWLFPGVGALVGGIAGAVIGSISGGATSISGSTSQDEESTDA